MRGHEPVGLASVLRRNPKLSAAEMDGKTVMMDIERGRYFALDPVGGAVWELLEQPATVAQVIDHVAQSFDAPDPEVLRRDLQEFLGELLEQGLIETVTRA